MQAKSGLSTEARANAQCQAGFDRGGFLSLIQLPNFRA
jgi:hypothetical protein